MSRSAASLFFCFWKSSAESHILSGEAQVKALPVGGDSFLLLLNSLRSRIVGTRGTALTSYSSISTNKIRTPFIGLQTRRSSRVPASILSSGIYGAGTGPRLAHSFPSSSSLFLHSQYQCFVAIIFIDCQYGWTLRSLFAAWSDAIAAEPRRSSERNQTVASRDNRSHRDGTSREAQMRLEELLQAKPKRRGVAVELKPMRNGVLKAKRLGTKWRPPLSESGER